MFCRLCGNKLPDDAVFCGTCGTRVVELEANAPPSSPANRPAGAFNTPTISRTTGPDQSGAIPGNSPPYPLNPANSTSSPSYPAYPTLQAGPTSSLPYPTTSAAPTSGPYPYSSTPTSSPQYGSYPTASSASSPQYSAYPDAYPNSNFSYAPYPSISQSSTIAASPTQGAAVPRNAVQRLLLQVFGPALAVNPFLGVILGGVIAIIAGVLVCGLVVAIAHAVAPHISSAAGYSFQGENLVDYALGIVPLHDLFRDSLQLFIVIQGAGTHYLYTYNTSTINTYYIAPLCGLLIIPALFLTLGGYIAASTDFQHTIRSSLWRGALVAIPYAVLLYVLSLPVNGCVPTFSTSNAPEVCSTVVTASTAGYSINIDTLTLVFFALLWGTLFGLLGASLKLAQGRWRQSLFHLLRSTSRPQVAGMFAGGLAAAGLGIALSTAALFSFVAYTSYSLPLLTQSLTCSVTQNWQSLLLWSISQGPFYAVNLLFFALGAPLNISNPQANSCFYIRSTHLSISLFGSTPALPPWFHLLLAIPALSLFLGGRVSAALGRVRAPGAGAVQGALAAVPFAALCLLLVPLSSVYETYTSNGGGTGGSNIVTQTAGVGVFELLLWALLGGAIIAAIGGLYQTSPLQPALAKALRALALPFRVAARPFYALLDRVSGQPRNTPRSVTRSVLYAALLWMALLAIIAGVGGGVLLGLNQTVTQVVNQRARDILSSALVALPCLLFIIACAAALCRGPARSVAGAPVTPRPVTTPVPPFYGHP